MFPPNSYSFYLSWENALPRNPNHSILKGSLRKNGIHFVCRRGGGPVDSYTGANERWRLRFLNNPSWHEKDCVLTLRLFVDLCGHFKLFNVSIPLKALLKIPQIFLKASFLFRQMQKKGKRTFKMSLVKILVFQIQINQNQEKCLEDTECLFFYILSGESLLGYKEDREVPASEGQMYLLSPSATPWHPPLEQRKPHTREDKFCVPVDQDTKSFPLHSSVSTVKTNYSSYKWPNTALSKLGSPRQPIFFL